MVVAAVAKSCHVMSRTSCQVVFPLPIVKLVLRLHQSRMYMFVRTGHTVHTYIVFQGCEWKRLESYLIGFIFHEPLKRTTLKERMNEITLPQ
jgi:hypothetical protein